MGRINYELSGQKFGMLSVLNKNGRNKRNQMVWKCLCDCGNTVNVQTNSLISKNTQSCGCAHRVGKGVAAMNGLFSLYKISARKRNIKFEITINEFRKITKSNCFYCGAKPSQICSGATWDGDYIYNGIDRVRNNEGYEKGNCVACCKICNYAKRDMSFDDFIEWGVKLGENLKKICFSQ